MNRKEVSEIKKNISVNNDLFVVNNVVVAFVDAEKQIKCKTNRSFTEIPDEELECILDTVTAGLSGTLGKGLVEYEFPKEAYEDGKQHEIIYYTPWRDFMEQRKEITGTTRYHVK